MGNLSPLFTWRSAVAESELPPTSKLVAFALSLHMNERGESCFPSQPTLARETSLSERAVREHLLSLLREGWIEREKRPGRSDLYVSTTPAGGSGVPQTDPGTTFQGPRQEVPVTPAPGSTKDVQEDVTEAVTALDHVREIRRRLAS